MNNMLYLTIFLGVMTAMAPLSTDMYLPALPQIARELTPDDVNRAQLVLTADDIVRELMWDLGAEPATLRPKPATPQLTPDETGLLGCFRTDDPLSHETLSELSGLDPGELATLLVGLELAGAVRQLPGNRYMKL